MKQLCHIILIYKTFLDMLPFIFVAWYCNGYGVSVITQYSLVLAKGR